MPVEERKEISYYSLRDGRITKTNDPNKGHQYESLWGKLVSIDHVKDSYEGEIFYKWHFKLEHPDPTIDSLDILQIGERASAARGLIASLLMIPRDTIHLIHMRPYTQRTDEGREYVNIWLQWADSTGEAWKDVEWNKDIIDQIPDVAEVKGASGKTFLDDTDRIVFVRKMAARIKKKHLPGGVPKATEKVDPQTGEITSGADAAETMYKQPPERVRQTSSGKVDQQMPAIDSADFDDMDDDLPF